jgi:hypothetical protein
MAALLPMAALPPTAGVVPGAARQDQVQGAGVPDLEAVVVGLEAGVLELAREVGVAP